MAKEDDIAPPPPYTDPETKHSFFQRHFCRCPKAGTNYDSKPPRFSLRSRGSIIAIILSLLTIIVVVLCAVLGTFYSKKREEQNLSPIRQVVVANFPDPALVKHEGTWYAFATNNAAGVLAQPANTTIRDYGVSNVQLATSQDFESWTVLNSSSDPLPRVGAWADPTFANTTPPVPRANVWAPEILQRPSDGKFIMFYSAATRNATRTHCVGAAISDLGPAGPYEPLDEALSCPTEAGGAIDAVTFIDVDGSIYVAWKIDGNNVGHGGECGNTVPPLVPTPIMLQKMQQDGTTPSGPATPILDRTDTDNDGPLVEAPSLIRTDEGVYFLFFSSGCTRAPSYDLKYAWARSITGPYTRAKSPLLKTGDWGLLAPGSVGIRMTGGRSAEMAFHGRVGLVSGRVRAMYTSHLEFRGTVAKLVP